MPHGLLNIAVGDFFNTKHILPTNNKEQEKIAKFLIELNKKIELLEKKLKNYQDFKKYLMQQIFAQKLRFNFTDEWDYLDFNKIFKSVSTKKYQIKSAEIMDNGDFEVIDQGQDEIAGYFNDKNKLCYELPIIIYGDHTTFVKFRDKPFIVGADGVKLLLPKIDANLKYLFYALEYFNIKPEGYKRHFSIIKKINLPLPSLEEQNEISEMFGSVDKKIMYTQKQLKETKKFKKSLLQQMFIYLINNSMVMFYLLCLFSYQLRFAGFNEEWKSFRLNEISERITRKNKSLETDRPLTISAQYGLVDQIEYFNKIVASKSLKGYYLLNKGEFAYNKSYSNGYPFGAVKRLDNYENGAISTLYICFSVNNNMNSELLKEYFETDKWYKEIYKIAVEGARNHGGTV